MVRAAAIVIAAMPGLYNMIFAGCKGHLSSGKESNYQREGKIDAPHYSVAGVLWRERCPFTHYVHLSTLGAALGFVLLARPSSCLLVQRPFSSPLRR